MQHVLETDGNLHSDSLQPGTLSRGFQAVEEGRLVASHPAKVITPADLELKPVFFLAAETHCDRYYVCAAAAGIDGVSTAERLICV